MTRRRVACISFSPLARDGRVLRQIGALARDHDVTALGYGPEADGAVAARGASFVALAPPERSPAPDRALKGLLLALGRLAPARAYPRWYWRYAAHRRARAALAAARADLVVANDWNTLPIALAEADATGAAVLADLHEFAPRQFEFRRLWRALFAPAVDHFLQTGLPRAGAVVTTSAPYADAYAERYGIRPDLVLNAPAPVELPPPRPTDARRVRVVHHGGAVPARRLEDMIEAVAAAGERFTLDLMLVGGPAAYHDRLRALAAARAPGRVAFPPPVAPDGIVARIAAYDVGLFLLPPISFQYRETMPNKLFEFVHAGLAVCIGPSPAMAAFVRRHDCGVVADDFAPATMARTLASLTAGEIDRLKARARAAARTADAHTEAAKLRAAAARALAAAGR